MAYTNVYSEAAPLGSTAANLIDDLMRSGKLDIRERLESIFGTGIFTTDPVTVTQIKLTGASAKIIPGTVGLLIKDNADANINVNIADNGDFAVNRGRLFINSAISKIIPGVTSFSVRNNADGADNIVVTDAGLVTLRNTLTVSAGGASITGGVTIPTGGLTVSAGAISLVGDVTLGGRLLFSTAIGKIVPGVTSISLRNNADNADNLIITDAGSVTIRGQVTANGANQTDRIRIDRATNAIYQSTVTGVQDWSWGTRTAGQFVINNGNLFGGSDVVSISIGGGVTLSAGLTVTGSGISVSGGGISNSIASGTAFISNTTANLTSDINQWIFQRGGVNKWRIGSNIDGANSDNFNIYSDVLPGALVSINTSGKTTIGSSAVVATVSLDIDTGLAAGTPSVRYLRGGVQKFRLGMSTTDDFAVFDPTGATVNGAITTGGIVNARVGFQIGGAGGGGKYLRGDGTNFVSSSIVAGDLPTALNPTTLQIATGAVVGRLVKASLTWNPGTVATGPGGTVSTTVTLTGAVVGDAVIFSNPWESDQAGCVLNAWVTSANTVTVTITQYSGSPTTFTSRTISVWIIG